jgi:hypothetical protein
LRGWKWKARRIIKSLIVFRGSQHGPNRIGGHHLKAVAELLLHQVALPGEPLWIVVAKHADLAVDEPVVGQAEIPDIVFDDANALDRHPVQGAGALRPDHAGDVGVAGRIAGAHEAPVAAGRAPADPLGLQNDHRATGSRQFEGSRQPRQSTADDDCIGRLAPFESRAWRCFDEGAGIIGVGIASHERSPAAGAAFSLTGWLAALKVLSPC